VASILLFLGLLLFMFNAGYQWRKWESVENPAPAKRGRKAPPPPRDTMLTKL
jgi:hypothetical protein